MMMQAEFCWQCFLSPKHAIRPHEGSRRAFSRCGTGVVALLHACQMAGSGGALAWAKKERVIKKRFAAISVGETVGWRS
jgi:hypothetical protein